MTHHCDMNIHDTDMNKLNALIEKYFDGATTLDEERLLRRMLADPSFQGESVDEARAVLGFMAAGASAHADVSGRRSVSWLTAAGVAASLAVAVTIGMWMHRESTSPDMIAYVGGCEISDRREVMDIVEADLAAFGLAAMDADMQIDAELSDIGDMLE